jgi:saccharopine dehydrogenase (NAD+, L-lysine-forming)
MAKVLIIGAGGVGRVVTFKCAQHPDTFSEIMLASRTESKCKVIAEDAKKATGHQHITTAQVDADNVPELVQLIRSFEPELVIHVALPYQGPYHYGRLPGNRSQLPGYGELRAQRRSQI